MKRIIIGFILLTLIILPSCANPSNEQGASGDTGDNGKTNASISGHKSNNSSYVNVDDIEVYENISEQIDDTFADKNRTYGAFYGNDVLEDSSCPKERVFVIKSQNDFDKIFAYGIENTPIDYQSEMYVLYTFTTLYHNEFVIEAASVVEQELNIQFRLKSPNEPAGDAARPFQRFILIKINKIDINNANFIDME